jgi:glutamate-1-semialdehyde aminotransferase
VEAAASERMGRLFMYLLDTGVLVNTNGLACLSTPMGEAERQEIVQAFDRALWQLRRAR